MRHARAGFGILAAIIAAYVGLCGYDARYRTITYTCDASRDFSIDPFLSNDALYAEAFLGGWVDAGEVTLIGFPSSGADETIRFSSTAVSDNPSASYIGDWYGRDSRVQFESSPQASCYIEIVFRTKSALSVGPLGLFW